MIVRLANRMKEIIKVTVVLVLLSSERSQTHTSVHATAHADASTTHCAQCSHRTSRLSQVM